MKLFQKLRTNNKGFTLIELLIVIGILAVLLAITLIALNPKQNFADANNSQRRSDVTAILDAINQYSAANKGALPPSMSAVSTATAIGSGTGQINLCTDLVPTYIADMPIDPTSGTKSPASSLCTASGTTYAAGYTVAKSTGNRVTVAAPNAEASATISVTR